MNSPESPLYTRRQILGLGAVGMGGLTAEAAQLLFWACRAGRAVMLLYGNANKSPVPEMNPGILQLKELIKQVYGLEIYHGPPVVDNELRKRINVSLIGMEEELFLGQALSASELEQAIILIADEICKYPPDFFRKNNIKSIRLIKGFRYMCESVAGLHDAFHHEAILDFTPSDFYNLRITMHHEFYHICDLNEKGGNNEAEKEKWDGFHKCNCYPYLDVTGMDLIREEATTSHAHLDWYVSPYGSVNYREDGAEIAERLMIPSNHRNMLASVSTLEQSKDKYDRQAAEIRGKKISEVKSKYLLWSGGQMGDHYWDDLLNERVDAEYFNCF